MRRHLADLGSLLPFFLRERKRALIAGTSLASLTVLCGVALLGLSGWFITATAIAGLSVGTALAFDVFAPSAGIRLLTLARTASRYGERTVTHDATLSVLATLRERLFRGWAVPGAAHRLLQRPGRLLFRLTSDVDALDALYLRVLVPAATAAMAAAAACIALSFVDWRLGLAVGGTLLTGGLGVLWTGGRLAGVPSMQRAHATEWLRARTIDLVAGQSELIMTGGLLRQQTAVIHEERRLARIEDRLNRIDVGVTIGLGVVSAGALSGTLVAVALLSDEQQISAPAAAMAVLVALAASEPFGALRRGTLELGRALLAAGRIGPQLAAAPDQTAMMHPDEGAIRCKAVNARHHGADADSLADISFMVERGERVAIIGASGAGKSTLLQLLAGEVAPNSGSVACLSSTLATQRSELFRDTIRDNLRLADPAAEDSRLLSALDTAGLGEFVRNLPHRLDTPLGEGGQGLSGGQLRRLALARIFLRNPDVVLLDEPTEGLDGDTAHDVLLRLEAWAQNRTVVVATHVRREAEIADRLLVIEDGRIVADLTRGQPEFDRTLAALRPD